MLCSHRRLTGLPRGLLPPAYCSIRRKISAAFAARVAGVDEGAPTSLRLASLTTAFRRLGLSTGFESKCGGITGRWAKLHLPRFDVVLLRAPGFPPDAHGAGDHIAVVFEVLVVFVKFASHGVSARTMSWATEGFRQLPVSWRSVLLFICLQFRLARARTYGHAHARPGFTLPKKSPWSKVCFSTSRPAAPQPRLRQASRSSLPGVHGKGVFAVQDIAEGEPDRVRGRDHFPAGSWTRHPHDPQRPQPHLLSSHGRRASDRCQARRQFLALDQPLPRWQLRSRRGDGASSFSALRNIAAGEELNHDYGLIIDERYTKKLKAEYPCWCAEELPRYPARPRDVRHENS